MLTLSLLRHSHFGLSAGLSACNASKLNATGARIGYCYLYNTCRKPIAQIASFERVWDAYDLHLVGATGVSILNLTKLLTMITSLHIISFHAGLAVCPLAS